MDLRERKLIINGAVVGGVNLLGSAINSFGGVKSSGDIMQESGTSIEQGSGFTYHKQNSVDTGAQMSELSRQNTANTLLTAAAGASLGSAFGPIGAGIGGVVGGAVGLVGGLFRKSKMADRIREAQLLTIRNNNFSLASALTDYLSNQYNLEHDNALNDLLYSAKDGHKPVYSASGYADGKPNAMGSHHEWVIDTFNGEEIQLPGKPDKEDTVELKLKHPGATAIVSNNRYLDGIRNSDYYTLTKDLDGALARDQWYRNMRDYRTVKQLGNGSFNAKNGILPGFRYGKKDVLSDWQTALDSAINEANEPYELKNTFKTPWEIATGNTNPHYTTEDRAAVTATREPEKSQDNTYKGNYSYGVENALATLFGLATAYGQRPKGPLSLPNTNTYNQYESQALSALAGLSTNEAAEKEAAYNTEARNRYNINMAGGLSGAQKYLSAVLSGIGLQRNIAGIIADNNAKRNGYITNWAATAAQLGGQGAARAQQALTHDYDAYARAHGAAIQQANMSSLNALSQIQQYLKNMQKIGMFNRTMAYYDLDYQLRKDALNRGWYNIG